MKYFRENGMTPALIEKKRGFTDDMMVRLINNTNKAWCVEIETPAELQYNDEVFTDDESGRLPRRKRGASRTTEKAAAVKRKREAHKQDETTTEEEQEEETEESEGEPPRKGKDRCPSKQPYRGPKPSTSAVSSETVYVQGDPNTSGLKGGKEFVTKPPGKGKHPPIARKTPRHPLE